jgi:hypothetical protein
MLPWYCLIYYFSIVLYCVIKCSCHPWITYESDLIFFNFFTYGKSVLVNTLNVVNHSHSFIHSQTIDLYYSKFTWVSRLFIDVCEPIKTPFWILSTNQKKFPRLVVVFKRDWKKSSTPASVCKIIIDQTFFLGFFWLMKVYVVVGFTVQYIDNINISYIVWI